MVLGTLLLVVTVSAPAFPQGDGTADTAEGAVNEDPVVSKAEATVETILRQQEQSVSGQRFAYEAEGRRDPFQSLMTPVVHADARPPGVNGMLVSELDLAGVVRDLNSGDVAMFIGSDNKGYFLRIGDAVFDGTVIAVDSGRGTVTFRQQVDDPRLIKPYRDVIKRLVPEEGTK